MILMVRYKLRNFLSNRVMVCFSTWTVLHGGGLRLRSELHDVRDFIIVVLKTLLAVSVADAACINNF